MKLSHKITYLMLNWFSLIVRKSPNFFRTLFARLFYSIMFYIVPIRKELYLSNLKFAFQDHGRQEEILEKSSIDYTICRAPMLSNEINNAEAIATPEGKKPVSRVLSRNSAAAFFLEIIEKNKHVRETISISNKPALQAAK